MIGNVVARIAALASLAVATLVVARAGGPAAVGIYALLRVVTGLAGVVISSGLPGAVTYFLAGPAKNDRRLPLTIVSMAIAGGSIGALVWVAGAPLLGRFLFQDVSLALVTLAGATVLTKLLVATAKSCCQGTKDLRGANVVIVNEELMFLPAYGLLWFAGVQGQAAVVVGLMLADVATFTWGWTRLARRGFFRGGLRPSASLAREIAAYGLRAQVGGVILLLNLRLDFVFLSVIAGPAVLGVYAIASKFAEFVKIPTLALSYVLYPRYASDGASRAFAKARVLIPKAGLLVACGVVPMALVAGWVIPIVYGSAFDGAVDPARLILIGLAFEGVAAVSTAFLYGAGRPGLNSLAMGAGLVVTIVLDLVLIPVYGAMGAAAASAAAYATTTAALFWFFWSFGRSQARLAWDDAPLAPVAAERR